MSLWLAMVLMVFFVPVFGQWFHLGNSKITEADSVPDPQTSQKLSMIIRKVYDAGGCTHIWLWGDDQRSETSKSTKSGVMGSEEIALLDIIHEELNNIPGWTMSYGFDLLVWVTEAELDARHTYLWSKLGWNHLLGAHSWKNKIDQISEVMGYSSYEYHKPWYSDLINMRVARPAKPTFSEDRYRKRKLSK